jgi:hypothetical protein
MRHVHAPSDASNGSDPLDTDLHRQWRADRARRLAVPLRDAWRGCLGLAMLLDRPDDTEAHGGLALVCNDQVRWLALRDVPVGHCPGSPLMNRRDVNLVNSATATLRHGMPVIDFTAEVRDGVDFKFLPSTTHIRQFGKATWDVERVEPLPDTLDCDRRQREFAVLNRVSAAMTDFAFRAVDPRGRPLRPAWAACRPEDVCPGRPASPDRWMPRPYLAFPLETVDEVCRLATGDDDACRTGRAASASVSDAFADQVVGGLPLVAVGHEVYCGPLRPTRSCATADVDRVPRDFVPHKLKSQLDGRCRVVHLPPAARVTAKQGGLLQPGDRWATVFDAVGAGGRHSRRAGRHPGERRDRAAELCGGTAQARHLLRTWLRQRMVRLAIARAEALIPAELVAAAVHFVRPTGLWWDSAPALPFYDWQSQASVFPPVRLRRWDDLSFGLPGETAVLAGIADPRFRAITRAARLPRRLRLATQIDGSASEADRGHCRSGSALLVRAAVA